MLPGMTGKARIAVVGAGNFGTALAKALKKVGFPIEAVIGRSGRTSTRARALARDVGARVPAGSFQELRAEVVWLCVPDSEIAVAARSLADKMKWKGRIAFHSSGALSSDELAALRARGAAVASVHPMMTFVRGSRPALVGVPFAIEGDVKAVRTARRIVRDLGGEVFLISKRQKAAYHAWGTFASPLLTALLATTERVAGLAGVNAGAARRRMIPILMQTLANYREFGAAEAFSGPIVRGDVETVRRHLQVLKSDEVLGVYVALARAALRYLPTKNKAGLRRVLDGAKG